MWLFLRHFKDNAHISKTRFIYSFAHPPRFLGNSTFSMIPFFGGGGYLFPFFFAFLFFPNSSFHHPTILQWVLPFYFPSNFLLDILFVLFLLICFTFILFLFAFIFVLHSSFASSSLSFFTFSHSCLSFFFLIHNQVSFWLLFYLFLYF